MLYVQRCALMILSCHDSVGLLRANWNTAVRRGNAGNAAAKKLFKKEEVDSEWYSRRSRKRRSADLPRK